MVVGKQYPAPPCPVAIPNLQRRLSRWIIINNILNLEDFRNVAVKTFKNSGLKIFYSRIIYLCFEFKKMAILFLKKNILLNIIGKYLRYNFLKHKIKSTTIKKLVIRRMTQLSHSNFLFQPSHVLQVLGFDFRGHTGRILGDC